MSGLLSPSFLFFPHHLLCVQWVFLLSVTEPAHCSICRSSCISGRPIPQHLSGLSSFFRDASPNQLLAFFLISCVPFLHLASLLLECTRTMMFYTPSILKNSRTKTQEILVKKMFVVQILLVLS